MKKYLLFGLLLLTCLQLTAQTNANEAKAAYLLAEESYGKGDYKNALEFLRQVREALGSANCKVLYLQIMATREMYAKDTSANSKLLPLILEFEKSADYTDFNEEKSLEITKLKLLVKKEMRTAQEKADSAAAVIKQARELRAKSRTQKHKEDFIGTATFFGPFNISLEELDRAQPKWKIKKWEVFKTSSTVDFYHIPRLTFTLESFPFSQLPGKETYKYPVSGIYVKGGKVIGYQLIKQDVVLTYNGATELYKIYTETAQKIVQAYNDVFLLDPVITPIDIAGCISNRYLWAEGRYGIMIEETHHAVGDFGRATVVYTTFYNPTEKETANYHPAEK